MLLQISPLTADDKVVSVERLLLRPHLVNIISSQSSAVYVHLPDLGAASMYNIIEMSIAATIIKCSALYAI